MSTPGPERPRLVTPEGGTMSQPKRPKDYHGYPYVWAWHVTLGAISSDYIEQACRQAAQEGAPADAVYKYDGEWITIDQVDEDNQARVRAYGDALTGHARDVRKHLAALQNVPKLNSYTLAFPGLLQVTVRAPSLAEAYDIALTDHRDSAGNAVIEFPVHLGRAWIASFDGRQGKLLGTTASNAEAKEEKPPAPPTPSKTALPDGPGHTPAHGVEVRPLRPADTPNS